MGKSNVKALLKAAKLPERAVSVCLRGDLIAEMQRLEDELAAANEQRAKDKRLGGPSPAEIGQRIEDLRRKMREESLTLTFRAYSSDEWKALKFKYPLPEEPSPQDRAILADSVALFNEAVRESVVSPELDDDDWADLMKVCAGGDWDRMVEAVYALNEQGTSVPKSPSALLALRTSDGV